MVTAGSLERFVMPVSLTERARWTSGLQGFGAAAVRLRRFGRRGPSKTVWRRRLKAASGVCPMAKA
ncbi:hypothetical protein HMPREF9440_01552 [Sutterella parvirubra YIT 11816]|uniref:Uncharacterized protein n=1 Tax=Sutterella parvirubra YIT 11816 TaxID=762967 RepID=H3KFN3_9BURK|nr:hypothetical protein HMPREF9440_01552 [Sutterella parvirubra YIT 11816]